MNDLNDLETYDPNAYDRPSVAVDLVLMSVVDGALCALLMQRDQPPARGLWALPGGFVGIDESLDAAARRIMRDKARLDDAYLEQLYTFGAADRDPRMRIISVAYFALMPVETFVEALAANPRLILAKVTLPDTCGAEAALAATKSGPLKIAFDHAAILAHAISRLRGKLNYTPVAFALLPEYFTLRALQEVHEAILGTTLNKPAFRRRLLDSGWLRPTGEREQATSFRPAELYRYEPMNRAANDPI